MEKATKGKLASFFLSGKKIVYKKGEIIFRPDDIPSGVYYIEQGHVKVYGITEDGEEKLRIIYKQEELFPLIWVIQNKLKGVFYEAMETVTIRRVLKEEFLEFVRKDPEALLELTERLVTMVNIFADRVENLEISRAYPRLVMRLLLLGQRFGVKEGKSVVIEAPISHKDIANSIHMTRETASRELEILKEKGLISSKNHCIVLTDIKKLVKELAGSIERESL